MRTIRPANKDKIDGDDVCEGSKQEGERRCPRNPAFYGAIREGHVEEVTDKLRRMKGTAMRRVKRRVCQAEGTSCAKAWGGKGFGMWNEASVVRMEEDRG